MTKKNILIISAIGIIILISLVVFFFLSKKEELVIYNIKFDTDGGTIVAQQNIIEGEKIKKPDDPIKDGYVFVEWTYQNKTYDFSQTVNKDMTLKANWLENKEFLTIKFDSDGGTTVSNQIIEKNGKIQKPENPIKDGYTFKYWSLNDKEYDFNKEVQLEFELKAIWEKNEEDTSADKKEENKEVQIKKNKYTVTFDSNGGNTIDTQTVTEGGKASKPANPTRDWYTFEGWMLDGSSYDFNAVVTKNITLVAKWKEIIRNDYTVTFNSNGGSQVSNQVIKEGDRVSEPTSPTKEGYTFAGWKLNGNNYDFNTPIGGNITLTASWTQKSYTIIATPVDKFSTDSTLTVYENGTAISVKSIKYTNGTILCQGSNPTVANIEIEGITNLNVVLSGGTEVTAVLQ